MCQYCHIMIHYRSVFSFTFPIVFHFTAEHTVQLLYKLTTQSNIYIFLSNPATHTHRKAKNLKRYTNTLFYFLDYLKRLISHLALFLSSRKITILSTFCATQATYTLTIAPFFPVLATIKEGPHCILVTFQKKKTPHTVLEIFLILNVINLIFAR